MNYSTSMEENIVQLFKITQKPYINMKNIYDEIFIGKNSKLYIEKICIKNRSDGNIPK